MTKDNISLPKFETSLLIEPIHTNVNGNAHGGELVKIMDNVAGVAAIKYTKGKGTIVTAKINEVIFHKGVHVGDIITCTGQLIYVGRSSILILVNIVRDNIEDCSEKELLVSASFTMVCLQDGVPLEVPKLVINTEEDEKLYKIGEKIYKSMKTK